jgi:hypothetical protein
MIADIRSKKGVKEMKIPDNYNQVVAIAEKSCGNETIGDMWVETKIFDKGQAIFEIIKWAKDIDCTGKLIITVPKESN